MKTWKHLLPALLALALAAPSQAADEQGAFAVRGPGALPCRAFVEARQGKDGGRDFLLWADGYVSALNLSARNTFDLLPWGNEAYLAVLLEAHCKRYPDQPFHVAVNKLLEGLKDWRLRQRSPQIEAQRGGAKVLVYAETLRRVQQRLKEKGLYPGAVDGRFGEATAEAIARYQRQQGLPPTGLPDYATLHRLFLEGK